MIPRSRCGQEGGRLAYACAAAGIHNPVTHPVAGSLTNVQRVLRGMAHVLGKRVKPTERKTLRLVLDIQDFCMTAFRTAQANDDVKKQLHYLYLALYCVQCFMCLLRPNEPFLQTLWGAWSVFFLGTRRVEAVEYLGIRFDYPVENAAELGWVGGVTKTSKSGRATAR